jgi:hypothetical protein
MNLMIPEGTWEGRGKGRGFKGPLILMTRAGNMVESIFPLMDLI